MRVKHFPCGWRNFCNKVLQIGRIIFAILWGTGRWLDQCSGPVRQAGGCLLPLPSVLTVHIFRCCLPVMHVRCADGAYRPSSPLHAGVQLTLRKDRFLRTDYGRAKLWDCPWRGWCKIENMKKNCMFWAIVCYTKEIQSQLEKARHFEHIPNLLNLLMGDWY